MKRMWRTTILMLVVAGIAGGIVWTVQKDEKAQKGEPEVRIALFPFMGEQVTFVEVKGKEGTIVLQKKEGKWRITSPKDFPADPARVVAQLASPVNPETVALVVPEIARPKDPSVHGLDAPTLQVTLKSAEGTVELDFGNEIRGTSDVYVRRRGMSEILKTRMFVKDVLNFKVEALRDNYLFNLDIRDLKSLVWSSQGKEFKVARQGRAWRMTGSGGIDDFADPAQVEEWLAGHLGMVKTPKFDPRTKTPAELGLEPAFALFEAEMKDGRKVTLAIGAELPDVPGRRWAMTSEVPGELGTIEAAEIAQITPQVAPLQGMLALPLPLLDASSLSASGPVEFEVKKNAAEWTLVKPVLLPKFEPGRVEDLLKELATAPAMGRGPGAEPPAGAIHVVVKWAGDAPGELAFDVWEDRGETVFRTADPPRVVRSTGTKWWDHLDAGHHFFRNPVLFGNLMPIQIVKTVVKHFDQIWVDAENVGGGRWQSITSIQGKELDEDKIKLFNVHWINPVDTFVREKKDDPVTGLLSPEWKIGLVPNAAMGDGRERIILVGKDGPRNTKYAVVEGEDDVFLVDPKAAGDLRGGVWK